jgi:hypothetical protein
LTWLIAREDICIFIRSKSFKYLISDIRFYSAKPDTLIENDDGDYNKNNNNNSNNTNNNNNKNNNNNSFIPILFLCLSACQQRVADIRRVLKVYVTKARLRLDLELEVDESFFLFA